MFEMKLKTQKINWVIKTDGYKTDSSKSQYIIQFPIQVQP